MILKLAALNIQS